MSLLPERGEESPEINAAIETGPPGDPDADDLVADPDGESRGRTAHAMPLKRWQYGAMAWASQGMRHTRQIVVQAVGIPGFVLAARGGFGYGLIMPERFAEQEQTFRRQEEAVSR